MTMGGQSRIFDSNGCVKLFPTFQEFVQYVIATPNKPDVHWVSYNKVSGFFIESIKENWTQNPMGFEIRSRF